MLVEEARARGVDVTIDQYPYTASSTGTASLIPQQYQEGGQKALIERLDTVETRGRIKLAIVERIKFDRGGGDAANVVMANCAWNHALDGKSLADITKDRGREVTFENAAETLMEIQHSGGCAAVFHAISEEDVQRIMKYPFTMVASDGEIPTFGVGAPHPRSYGTNVRVLGRYVRELHTITLEDAVHKMSGLPAQRLKFVRSRADPAGDEGGPGNFRSGDGGGYGYVPEAAFLRGGGEVRSGERENRDRRREPDERAAGEHFVRSGEAVIQDAGGAVLSLP